ncbi:serine O-acetyltransferase EpsC [Alicyclobacillus shizuokensis]|uniref:serine O-acetyltransferase EpsC n=1 Tax=Alicyclobacillus shizuokensis TaxID=392014 RepID=UPI000AD1792C|nr:serine O-acetyltransferase EpsC [Alicyclobacillus shizuokensis]
MSSRHDIAQQMKRQCCQWFEGRACHPEPDGIRQIVQLVRQLMACNYFPPESGRSLGDVVDDLHVTLARQIHRALFRRCYDQDATPESRAEADAKADLLIARLPDLQAMLYDDVLETYNNDPAATGYDEIILTYPGLQALLIYRVANALYHLDVPLLPRMMTEYGHRLTGVDIHPGATIGRGIMIDHATGIVIGETAVVGDHVKIYQGVTIGALHLPRDEAGLMVRRTKRHPTIEDGVVLYANATVLGGDTVIGHHSVIGSSAWVTESVPPYSKVFYQAETVVRLRRG